MPDDEETIRSLSEEAVHLAVNEMAGGEDDGGGGGGGGDGGCVSEEGLRKEVDEAIRKLTADGTGRRDYANAAVGGKVVSGTRTGEDLLERRRKGVPVAGKTAVTCATLW